MKIFHTRVVEAKCEEVLELSLSYNTDIPGAEKQGGKKPSTQVPQSKEIQRAEKQ